MPSRAICYSKRDDRFGQTWHTYLAYVPLQICKLSKGIVETGESHHLSTIFANTDVQQLKVWMWTGAEQKRYVELGPVMHKHWLSARGDSLNHVTWVGSSDSRQALSQHSCKTGSSRTLYEWHVDLMPHSVGPSFERTVTECWTGCAGSCPCDVKLQTVSCPSSVRYL